MNFSELRKKHQRFVYEAYKWEKKNGDLIIDFEFLLEPNIKFNPSITIPLPKEDIETKQFESFIFHLGLVEAISYWKAACSPEFYIKAGCLSKEQIGFWQDLFINGLGEFFYKNNIDFTQKDFLKITSNSSKRSLPVYHQEGNGDLVLTSGGKDSAVVLEVVKKSNRRLAVLMLNPTLSALEVVKVAGIDEQIIAQRRIDPKLLELNKQGYFNGHTPFSAYLAFLGVFVSALHGLENVVSGNERSSEEGNVFFRGREINHQYSKTYKFEKLFRDYSSKYLTNNVNYFSLLRPIYDLAVSKIFAHFPKYHKVFRSCNRGVKKNAWCGNCPKCAFVYLSLSPFLPDKKMIEIFGSDYFKKKSLDGTFQTLLGTSGHKPFECVGTIEESKTAFSLIKNKSSKADKLLKNFGKDHFLPSPFEEIFKLIMSDSVLILGYGREGKSVHRFFIDNFPFIKIAIADREKIKPINKHSILYSGKDYLSHAKEFTTIVRSPGVSPSDDKFVQVTSSTNIFFSQANGRVVGITGTKGKSTTSSLIARILESSYSDVRLIGNIGNPSLDSLKGSSNKTIFVFELSSHQLADCRFSPSIAVVLDVVSEHLDYYKDFSSYVKAKENIVRHQKASDFVIFNKEHKISSKIAQKSTGKKLSFSQKDIHKFMNVSQISLLGKGNLENVMAAVVVGRLFGVSDREIRKAVKNFVPLEHRLEYIGEFRKVRFYNDSLATVPQATIHALEALGDDVETLIAGGFDRGIDFSKLNKFLEMSSVKNLILFPTTGKRILKEKASRFNVSTMEKAVKIAFEKTAKGKICLLSPASASFGIFKDYDERGKKFKKLVRLWQK